MKAKKHTTAIITALFLGFITLNAQTSDKRERATVKRPEVRQTQTKKTSARKTTQARQTAIKPQRQQTTKTTQSRVNTERPHRNTTTRYRETATASRPAYTRPASISNRNNPRSDYRAPEHRTHMKKNKFSEKRYYSGNHYHHVYPKRHIKTRYHHNTYIHHYNVLYYPSYHEIFWTRNMYRDYRRWYPNYHWRYDYGYRIQTMSIFDAKYNFGELAMVYGRVYATWHNKETDDYLLFFGGDYPAQQFTVVLPGNVARRFNWRPERYFLGEHMTVTGLITTFDGIPEIIVKNKRQVGIY